MADQRREVEIVRVTVQDTPHNEKWRVLLAPGQTIVGVSQRRFRTGMEVGQPTGVLDVFIACEVED